MAKVSFNFVGLWPKDADQATIMQVLESAKTSLPEGEINIKLVDDKEITALNTQYSGNAYTTDVLSFSYIENGQNPEYGELGDIAISLETAKSQADQANTDLTTELALLSLHGLLHIDGSDHDTEASKQKIEDTQAKILKQNGLTYREFKWQ